MESFRAIRPWWCQSTLTLGTPISTHARSQGCQSSCRLSTRVPAAFTVFDSSSLRCLRRSLFTNFNRISRLLRFSVAANPFCDLQAAAVLESSKIALTSTSPPKTIPLAGATLDRNQPSPVLLSVADQLKNICAACRSKGESQSSSAIDKRGLGARSVCPGGSLPLRTSLRPPTATWLS